MIKLVLSAVRSALRLAWQVLKAAAMLPLMMLAGGATVPPLVELEPSGLDADDYEAIADGIRLWAVHCARAGAMQPPSDLLPDHIQAWLTQLNLREAVLLLDAPRESVVAHVSGQSLPQLPPVGLVMHISQWRAENRFVQDAQLKRSARWGKLYPDAAVARERTIEAVPSSIVPEDGQDVAEETPPFRP